MATFKCKMCGGQLEIKEGQTVITCEFCGTAQTVPHFDNEKKATFFRRANDLRLKCEFDKASGVYETIVTEFPNEAEAYWGLVLCKYGIEYVDDPKTGKKIPTCHRTQFASIFEDHDYLAAIRNADAVARELYKREANAISKLQSAILEISSKEDPFDIFICYKETDERGGRTPDSVLSQDIYDELTSAGYKVFFARRTLERRLGSEYEPYIFAALHSSKVMVHVTTNKNNSESVWVKNEWARYLSLIAEGQKKTLIPCYKGINAYDLPDEMKNLQAQDMSKLGAMQDLVYGIKKIIKPNGITVSKETEKEEVFVSDTGYDALIRKGYTYLKNHKMEQAKRCFEKAVEATELCGDAYLGILLCEYQLESLEELLTQSDLNIFENENFKLAREFANKSCNATLDNVEKTIIYNEKKERYSRAKGSLEKGSFDVAIEEFKELGDFEDSPEQIKECIYQKGQMYFGYINNIKTLGYCNDAIACFEEIISYKDSQEMIDKTRMLNASIVEEYKTNCVSKYEIELPKEVSLASLSELVKKVKANKDRVFVPSFAEFDEARNNAEGSVIEFFIEKTPALIQSFKTLEECSRLNGLCSSLEKDNNLKRIHVLIKQRESELKEQIKVLKRKKRKKTIKISAFVCGGLAIAVAAFFGIKAIVDENNRKSTYASAAAAMEAGDYDKAISYYQSLGDYQESKKKITVCNGLKQLEESIQTKSESDMINGIKTVVSGGEKVEVSYETENNVNINRNSRANSGNTTQTISTLDFVLYKPTWDGYTFLKWNSDSLSYKTGRAYLGAMSNWSLNAYSITYVLDGGTNNPNNPTSFTVESNDLMLLDATKENYQFLGWFDSAVGGNKVTSIPSGTFVNVKLYAHWEINHYNVYFYNGDELLDTVLVDHGGTAEYTKATPTKQATAQYTYTFTGWDKILTNVTHSFSTYAEFSSTINKYKVTFYDYDETTVLDSSYVDYGSNATYTKATPTRPTDDSFVYTFSGWDKPLSTIITGDTSFYAQYSTTNRYLCRFFVDGEETYRTIVTEGENVSYKGVYPTREQTAQYVYDFDHWDKSLEHISSNTDFNAVFNATEREYQVTFHNYDGTVLFSTYVTYGNGISYSGNTPTKPMDEDYVYTFSGWDKETSNIVGETHVYAQFTSKHRYVVKFYDYTGNNVLYSTKVTEGESASYVGSTPTKPADAQYTYTFSHWDKSLTGIISNTDFYPVFNTVTNQYTVTFVNFDGTFLYATTVDYGTEAVYVGSTPTKPIDNEYKYTFSGWDVDITSITGNVTATAQYSLTNRYLCIYQNYNGNELYREYVTEGESSTYKGSTPTRTKTQKYTYTFNGWDKSQNNISEHTTFTAQFRADINYYDVYFVSYSGTEILAIISVPYGGTAVYDGPTPTRPKQDGYRYVFTGWNQSLENVTDHRVVGPVFEAVPDVNYEFVLNDDEVSYTLNKFTGTFNSVTIPDTYEGLPVTGIGDNCFKNNTYIKTVIIPNSIKKIGSYAFSGCSNITSIYNTQGSQIEYIGEYAFYGIFKAQSFSYGMSNKYYPSPISLFIPSTCTYIGKYAFYFSNTSPTDGYSGLYFAIGICLENGVDTTNFVVGDGPSYGYQDELVYLNSWDSWKCGSDYHGGSYGNTYDRCYIHYQYSETPIANKGYWYFNENGRIKFVKP